MLIDNIYGKYKTISIIGMAKNSGKTVTLNYLIQEAFEMGLKIGILSTGRDGETVDVLTETEKPKIFVEEGTVVATTSNLLSASSATVEIIKVTDSRTPLGNVLIGKVKESGFLQISGPQTSKDIKNITNMIIELGTDMVIIDGALDRKFSAAPSISEATILAAGAVVSRDMNRVIEETAHLVNLFNLSSVENIEEKKIIEDLINSGHIAIIDRNLSIKKLDIKTALNSGKIIGENIDENSKYVVIPGSLINKTLEDIVLTSPNYKSVDIILSDATKIFISPKNWIKHKRYGVNVKVLNPINLVAVTLNPYAPQGYYFEPEEFLKRTRLFIKDIPVFDLMLGGV